MFGWFKRKEPIETRAQGTGFTAGNMLFREAYLAGHSGVAELTATVQGCVTLWENGFSIADVTGTDLLTKRDMAQVGRSLALRGESVFLIEETGLVVCDGWDMSTRNGKPRAYRLSIPEIGGGFTRTALAGEVLHFRIGSDISAPYNGRAPLKRASLTAGMLQAVETALAEVYDNAPIGSSVVPYPEAPETDMNDLSRKFRGYRGKVQVRESVTVAAAGGPAPAQDWKPQSLTPDIQGMMPKESLDASRGSIMNVFGMLPSLLSPNATGPLVREAQRHLAQWMLQPIAETIAEECTEKLGTEIKLDVMRPLQAYDAGGRARAAAGIVQAMAMAKEAGVDPTPALKAVDWNL